MCAGGQISMKPECYKKKFEMPMRILKTLVLSEFTDLNIFPPLVQNFLK